jgi:hypothetical protein
MVRAEGLEPPRLSSPEPKSGASTNSATPASRRLAWENPPLRAPSIASWPARARKKRRAAGRAVSGRPFLPETRKIKPSGAERGPERPRQEALPARRNNNLFLKTGIRIMMAALALQTDSAGDKSQTQRRPARARKRQNFAAGRPMRFKRLESLDPRKGAPFRAPWNQRIGVGLRGRSEGFSWSEVGQGKVLKASANDRNGRSR